WQVGDKNTYKMSLGFIKGSTSMEVIAVSATEIRLNQIIDMGFMGKQDCEMVIDRTNGQTRELTCDGNPQEVPEAGDVELIEMSEGKVTVPAGSFDCVYIKAKQKSSGQEIEQWVNTKQVPISGMVKSVSASTIGKVVMELVSFIKK